ncbi:unnamed protein product [Linum trigynum]|uniref:Uncharacterized protein n=1 Tax=Linum trigynum TaxID=586398 RepID=A0AAV2CCT3_9ROSI
MEGVGSRLGRASSRYGPSATANVFNGPVRKWKKKWVHVSPPPAANNNSSRAHSNGHHLHSAALSNSSNSESSRLLLCRWTPLAAGGGAGDDSSAADEPPKRRIRYTPIAALEERTKAAKSVDVEVKEDQITESKASEDDEPEDDDETMKEETQDPDNGGTLDLGLCLKGEDNENNESPNQHKEEANSSRAWAFG